MMNSSQDTNPPAKKHVLYISACLFLLSLIALVFSCASKPECTKDRECQQKYGEGFLCYRNKCANQNTFELPHLTDAGTETTTETGPDSLPGQDSIGEPEPTQEALTETPIERTPDVNSEGQRPLHSPCKYYEHAPASERCQPGLLCLRVNSTKAFCFQDCSQNESVCAANTDGRDTCHQVGWSKQNQAISICAKLSKKDELCDAQQSSYCTRNKNAHLVCKKGRCVSGTLCDYTGCACDDAQDPPVECDVSKKLVCNASGRCVEGIRAYEGDECTTTLSPRPYCPAEHLCVGFGQSVKVSVCMKRCQINNPLTSCSHRSNFICRELANGIGGCYQRNCKTQDDCQHQDPAHICAGASESELFCLPVSPTGTREFGELCNNADPNKRCKAPLFCITGPGKTNGFCTLQCESDTRCQGYIPSAKCSLINNTTKVQFCGWTCSDGASGPATLSCQGTVCFAP